MAKNLTELLRHYTTNPRSLNTHQTNAEKPKIKAEPSLKHSIVKSETDPT